LQEVSQFHASLTNEPPQSRRELFLRFAGRFVAAAQAFRTRDSVLPIGAAIVKRKNARTQNTLCFDFLRVCLGLAAVLGWLLMIRMPEDLSAEPRRLRGGRALRAELAAHVQNWAAKSASEISTITRSSRGPRNTLKTTLPSSAGKCGGMNMMCGHRVVTTWKQNYPESHLRLS
jgi:hypothetical protein